MTKKLLIILGIIFALFVSYMFGKDIGIQRGTDFYQQCIQNGASGYYILDNEINCIYEEGGKDE